MTEPIYLYSFRADPYFDERIEKVQVARYTDKSFWTYPGTPTRQARFNSWRLYYETYEDAVNALLETLNRKIEKLRMNVRHDNESISRYLDLKESLREGL